MAQLGSAGALGALGRRFESCRPDWDLREWQYYLCENRAKEKQQIRGYKPVLECF